VTGASKGIGLAIAEALAGEGARVVAGARGPSDELSALAGRADVRPVYVDLATPDGPAELIAAAIAAFGGLDIVVNNVGAVRPRTGGFLSVTDDDWTSTLTTNFLAAVRTTRAALPNLLDRGAGSIITISSVNATLPDPPGHRLQRRERRPGQLLQSTVQRGWTAGRSRQYSQPGPGEHRAVAR
jgi:NAD(P)-dependent dehydrogenase (short-subunit alcohol dehydrogenase family)